MKAKIIMTFDADGGVKTEVNGVKGRSCAGMTEFLDKEFRAEGRKLKGDYYQQENVLACTNSGSAL